MTDQPDATGNGVHDLVSQRDQLRQWIAKLDQVGSSTASRVALRVRADYEERLRRITEELAQHGEEVQRSLEQQREELAAAEERRDQAVDALEETRLRHEIGELDAGAWDEARAPLEGALAGAEEALEHTRGEVERLAALSAEISTGSAEPEAGEEAGPAAAPAVEDEDSDQYGLAPQPGLAGGMEQDDGEPALWQDPDPAGLGGDQEWDASALDPARDGDQPGESPLAAEPEVEPVAQGPVSGEELASWITEVEEEEAEASEPPAAAAAAQPEESAAPPPAPEAAAEPASDGWDPFANEFGGTPASPGTQPGDASRDVAWRESVEAAQGTPQPTAATPHDDLAFLEDMEAERPSAAPAGGDLADDDLAFLEELDRAISGGAQRPGAAPTAPAAGGPLPFTGGSGGTDFQAEPGEAGTEPRKRGEALLCKECGAINEPQAWYCEICGSEL